MKIVRVTRRQIHETYNKMIPQNRRMIPELMITNLYIQLQNVLLVAEDDVEFMNFPKDEEISIAAIVMKSVPHIEPEIHGFEKAVDFDPINGRHKFVCHPAIFECGLCGRGREEPIHF